MTTAMTVTAIMEVASDSALTGEATAWMPTAVMCMDAYSCVMCIDAYSSMMCIDAYGSVMCIDAYSSVM